MKRFKVLGAAVLGASLLLAGCLATTGLFYSRVSSDSRVVQYRPDQTRPDQTTGAIVSMSLDLGSVRLRDFRPSADCFARGYYSGRRTCPREALTPRRAGFAQRFGYGGIGDYTGVHI
jgi:hypothetical protein